MATSLLYFDAAAGRFASTTLSPAGLFTFGTNFGYFTLEFDQATAEKVNFHGVIPVGYTAAADISVIVYWKAGQTGDVVWGAKVLGRTDNETFDAALGAQATVTDSVVTINTLRVATISLVAPALAAGDWFILEIARNAAAAGDTSAGDASLIGVEVQQA